MRGLNARRLLRGTEWKSTSVCVFDYNSFLYKEEKYYETCKRNKILAKFLFQNQQTTEDFVIVQEIPLPWRHFAGMIPVVITLLAMTLKASSVYSLNQEGSLAGSAALYTKIRKLFSFSSSSFDVYPVFSASLFMLLARNAGNILEK